MKRLFVAFLCLAGCGARTGLDVPEAPAGPRRPTSLALGDMHSCVLFSDGTADCWGSDLAGELGDVGTGPNHSKPIALKDATGIVDLVAGNQLTCAIVEGGTLECWGLDSPGRYHVPPTVIGEGFSKVALGEEGCGIKSGEVHCWNYNTNARRVIAGVGDAVAIDAGLDLACVLREKGRVSCWGKGPLGDGTKNASATPVDVVGLHGPVKQLAVGMEHACVLLEDESVACWGSSSGALGLADVTDTTGLTAATIVGLPPAKRISGHSQQACAVLTDGTVRHWGTDYGPAEGSATPEPVPHLSSAVDVASGEFHNCALLEDRGVACWGLNHQGELGDGTNDPSETPVMVSGLP